MTQLDTIQTTVQQLRISLNQARSSRLTGHAGQSHH
ncbi:hypothetical protein N577_001245 [Lacticaseibacillus rhamnosus 2166]|nr:hypothetical protein N577_001245 [Lacticaseibacillus rhamnosus 2166]